MRPIFITGTDTDCGKTYVTCQLIQAIKALDIRCEAIKPIASGCFKREGKLYSPDALAISQYSELSLDSINPWRYEPPVSPHIAAEQAGERLSIQAIEAYCQHSQWQHLDLLLIEGAGGLAVPLNEEQTWLDFLKQSSIEVILVVGIKLGCINHALLTEYMLNKSHIRCIGWIANYIEDSLHLQQSEKTISSLKRHLNSPLLAEVPYQGQLQLELSHNLKTLIAC